MIFVLIGLILLVLIVSFLLGVLVGFCRPEYIITYITALVLLTGWTISLAILWNPWSLLMLVFFLGFAGGFCYGLHACSIIARNYDEDCCYY